MINVYKSEIEAGIADEIRSSASVAYASCVRSVDIPEARKDLLKEEAFKSLADANPDQFDLLYLESVLVSTGWNANDDVFEKSEIWTARNSPVDKQFNFMHNEADIIGHITSASVVDFNGNSIEDNAAFDDIPNDFDIVVGSVLYKYWSDPEKQQRMNQIIAGLADNKWFVSMECLFNNFDYSVITPAGDNKVIARNEDSSFLTKHLRIYGGSGEYQGHKLGRLLRNLSFSGKGLVDNPANKRSDILNFNSHKEVHSFAGAYASVKELTESKSEETIMAHEDTISKAQYDELKAELDTLKSEQDKVISDKIKALEEQNTELTETIAKLTSELDASKEVLAAKDETVKAAKEDLETAQAELKEAQDKIRDMDLAAAKASRLNVLLQRDIDNERAETLVDKFAEASDEMFQALVDSLPEKKEETQAEEEETEASSDSEMDDKKKKKDKTDAEDINADKLDEAEAEEEDAELNVDESEAETLQSKAASWLSDNVLKSTAGINKAD